MNYAMMMPKQNPTQPANTTQLGYAGVSPWGDSSAQNSQPNLGPNPLAIGGPGGSSNSSLSIGGNTLNDWIQKQLAQNNQARQQNQASFSDASNYLKQYANPLSPEIIAQMKSENATKAQAGANNSLAEQKSMMAGSGQGDAGSMAAAASMANRQSLGAQIGANTNLGIQSATLNNNAGMDVGKSILSNIPQYKPDDYSGLMALSLQQQNMQNQNAILNNQLGAPKTPMGQIDNKYRQDKYGAQAGGQQGYGNGGVTNGNPWLNGLPNGGVMMD